MLYTGWAKSNFILLKDNKTNPNKAKKKICYTYQMKDENLKFH